LIFKGFLLAASSQSIGKFGLIWQFLVEGSCVHRRGWRVAVCCMIIGLGNRDWNWKVRGLEWF